MIALGRSSGLVLRQALIKLFMLEDQALGFDRPQDSSFGITPSVAALNMHWEPENVEDGFHGQFNKEEFQTKESKLTSMSDEEKGGAPFAISRTMIPRAQMSMS